MPRRTKIVATLGPASSDPKTLARMIDGRARRRAHEFLARHRRRAPQARRAGARARAQGGPHRRRAGGPAGTEDPHRALPRRQDHARRRREVRARRRVQARRSSTRSGSITRTCPTTCARATRCCSTTGASCSASPRSRARASPPWSSRAAPLSNNKGINRKGGGLTAPALTEKDMQDIKTAAAAQGGFSRASRSRARATTSTGRAISCTRPAGER